MTIATRNHPFLFACSVELALLLTGIGFAVILRTPVLELLSWRFAWLLIGLAGTVPLLVVLIWLMNTAWTPVLKIHRVIDEIMRPFLGRLTVLQLLFLAILAGVAEEFFFRAFLQVWLSGLFGTIAGVILSSLLFGACHLVTRFYGLFASILGVYLGVLMLFTENIWPPAMAHALYDFLALVWIFKVRTSAILQPPAS